MKPSIIKQMLVYIELCKPGISLFAAFSSAAGFLLAISELKPDILLLVTGVIALASGAGALNQYQERTVDALMPRTEKRPIPSGRIEPLHVRHLGGVLPVDGLEEGLGRPGVADLAGLRTLVAVLLDVVVVGVRHAQILRLPRRKHPPRPG